MKSEVILKWKESIKTWRYKMKGIIKILRKSMMIKKFKLTP